MVGAMMSKPSKGQLPVPRQAQPLERVEKALEPDTIRQKRVLVIHHHTYNWGWIIMALAILIPAVAAVVS